MPTSPLTLSPALCYHLAQSQPAGPQQRSTLELCTGTKLPDRLSEHSSAHTSIDSRYSILGPSKCPSTRLTPTSRPPASGPFSRKSSPSSNPAMSPSRSPKPQQAASYPPPFYPSPAPRDTTRVASPSILFPRESPTQAGHKRRSRTIKVRSFLKRWHRHSRLVRP